MFNFPNYSTRISLPGNFSIYDMQSVLQTVYCFGSRKGPALEDSCYESDPEGPPKPLYVLGASSSQDDDGNEDSWVFVPAPAGVSTHSG